MATREYKTVCSVCGAHSENVAFYSTRWDLRTDLDARPCYDRRFDTFHQFEVCPSCGYASFDISDGLEGTARIVRSVPYQHLRISDRVCEAARKYLCAALLIDAEDLEAGLSAAARAYWQMWAAWTCEDCDDPEGAVLCRRMAVESLVAYAKSGASEFKRAGEEFILISDALRRCGDFAGARGWVERGLLADIDPRVRLQLEFERSLIEAGDTAAHLEDETPGWTNLE